MSMSNKCNLWMAVRHTFDTGCVEPTWFDHVRHSSCSTRLVPIIFIGMQRRLIFLSLGTERLLFLEGGVIFLYLFLHSKHFSIFLFNGSTINTLAGGEQGLFYACYFCKKCKILYMMKHFFLLLQESS